MSDLRTALESAFESDEAPVTETPVVETPTEVVETAPDRPRDEAGKFAPKAENVEQEITPAPEPPARKAPSSWKPAAQEAFLKADRGETLTSEEIKLLTAEAERRENDFHKGVSEFKTHSERARAYDQAIAPFQKHLASLNVDAPTAISALMRADVILRTSDPATKSQYFAQLARQYGVDLGNVQQPPEVDPQTKYLMDQMQTLRQQQEVWQNQIQQQEAAKANGVIHQMASDTAKYPHFEAVRGDMADLLQAGKTDDPDKAYEMAVWMRPDIRSTLIEQQRAEAQRKAEETARLQRARTASASVKGSSPSAGGVQPVNGSLRGILEAQFADN